MKQTLQLRIGQNLTMTPQLQQAIRLLQLSTIDLQAEIQEILETNPLLEAVDDNNPEQESHDDDRLADSLHMDERGDGDMDQSSIADIPDELPVDSDWEDTYDMPVPASSGVGAVEAPNFDNQSGPEESLKDHLFWQMRLTPFSDHDMIIAMAIIDAIDEQGYLQASLDDIRETLLNEHGFEEPPEDDEIEAVLHRIHQFDPLGVGCRNLQECLLVQLNHLSPDTPWRSTALTLVREHMELLGSRDLAQLMRKMKLGEDELKQALTLVQSMNPRPGSLIESKTTEYIIPDVVVRKLNGKWRVELNSEVMPKLRVNSSYASLIRRADSSADNTFMKNQLQEARWFIKSLQSRNETLLKVASCIVERQQGFLDFGEEAMKALVLHDVAETVGMHESTISRVTTQKYMHTPRGVFELKYFFSSHVGTDSGGECSATAIRALLKKLIAAEDPRKPLSDSKLANILGEQGIKVARRTIAKYRESISIPSSSERKRLI